MEPFDARRSMLVDADRRLCDRQTVSLVHGLRIIVQGNDHAEVDQGAPRRVDAALEILRELERRGLDGSSLIRFGLMGDLTWAVVELLLPNLLAGVYPGTEFAGEQFDTDPEASWKRQAWWSVLSPRSEETLPIEAKEISSSPHDEFWELVELVTAPLVRWVLTAPVEDLLTLTPPASPDEFKKPISYEPDFEVLMDYAWIVDRLAITSLTDWRTTSLHREYNWMRGTQAPPCSVEHMQARSVRLEALQAEIARRVAEKRPTHVRLAGGESSFAQRMVSHAAVLLHEGKHRQAAALFEFASQESPADPSAFNNLGFCQIKFDPRAAIVSLRRAASLGYANPLLNLYNRAVALFALADYRAALRLLDEHWEEFSRSNEIVIVWVVRDDDNLTLETSISLRGAAAILGLRTALKLGSLTDVTRWANLGAGDRD